MSESPDDRPVAVFRKTGRVFSGRKREAPKKSSSDNSSEEDTGISASAIQSKRQAKKKGKWVQSTRRRKDNEEEEEEESSDSSESNSKPKFELTVKYSSSGAGKAGPSDMGATKRTEHDTEYDRDAQAQFERIQKQLEEDAKVEPLAGGSTEKIYRGQAMYGTSFKTGNAKGNATSGLVKLGPIRATQYMRSSIRWDYAPDICKDYKETGFCTFGDSCKFLHDRSDYKHGWELERDWEEGKLKESKEDEFLISSEEDEEDLPFACYICRKDFVDPMVTKCNHYFCEICAINNCKKKCPICGAKTNGILTYAKNLQKKLKERQTRKEKEPQEGSESEELPEETVMGNEEESEDNQGEDEHREQNEEQFSE